MGKESGKRFKLGVFVTLGIALLMAAIYFIGQKQNLFSAGFRISGVFNEVSGLQVGNNVRFAGVNIGSVEAVTITGNNAVRVDLLISEEFHPFIKKDSIASIGSESMMGNKVVVIAAGTDEAEQAVNRDIIRTGVTVTIDDILKQVKHTSENAVVITSNLAQLAGSIREGKGTLGKMFMDDAFAKDVTATMVSLREGSAGFKEFMEAARRSWLLWGSGKNPDEKKKEEQKKLDEKKAEDDKKAEEKKAEEEKKHAKETVIQ